MGIKMRIPESPSGRELTGDAPQSGATTFIGWDPARREWGPYTVSGGGGDFVNLSNVVYVDAGTTVPLADQTGNIEAPYADLQDAVDALGENGVMFLVTGGSYGDLEIPAGMALGFTGISETRSEIGTLLLNDGASALIQGFFGLNQPVMLDVNTSLQFNCQGCRVFGESSITCQGIENINETDDTTAVQIVGTQGTLSRNGPGAPAGSFGNIEAGFISVCGVGTGDLTSHGTTNNSIVAVNAQIGDVSSAGGFSSDLATLADMSANGKTVSAADDVEVLDAPTILAAQINVVGASPGVQEFSQAFPGCQPGDTFVVTQRPTPGIELPPDTMLGSPWCEVAGTVIVPVAVIAATTDASVDLTVTRLAVGATAQ